MNVTRGNAIPYVDDTNTKKVMANVNATSFGVQFIGYECARIASNNGGASVLITLMMTHHNEVSRIWYNKFIRIASRFNDDAHREKIFSVYINRMMQYFITHKQVTVKSLKANIKGHSLATKSYIIR